MLPHYTVRAHAHMYTYMHGRSKGKKQRVICQKQNLASSLVQLFFNKITN